MEQWGGGPVGVGPPGEVRRVRGGHPRHAAAASFINHHAELRRGVDTLGVCTLVRVIVCVCGWRGDGDAMRESGSPSRRRLGLTTKRKKICVD